jgi:7-cyano-7-deazaguanine synthase
MSCTLVLTSGGIDSSTLLALLAKQGSEREALFIDHGQEPVAAEHSAAAAICASYCTPLRVVHYAGTRHGAGEIQGRNAFLVHVALMEFSRSTGTVAIGIHGGTSYKDCTPEFIEVMQRSVNFQILIYQI